MKAGQCRKSDRRGFTLMEVLVVAAIIAVLVAIAIPTVTRSLEKSRRAADLADARGILAVLSTGYLDGDIHFTTETFQGHPVCAAVVMSREGMQCFVSGATEIRGVSYDNSGGAHGHERMHRSRPKCRRRRVELLCGVPLQRRHNPHRLRHGQRLQQLSGRHL